MADLAKIGHHVLMNKIDNDTCKLAIEFIMKGNAKAKHERPEKLYIHLNSGGGSVYDGLALINVIKSSAVPVVTVGNGRLMSMGIMIFMSGHERLIHKDTTVMCHQWSQSCDGKSFEFKDSQVHREMLDQLFYRLYEEHTNVSYEVVEEKLFGKSDYYFDAKQAKNYGMADKVIDIIPLPEG